MQSHYALNCKGRLLNLSSPIVMGILNITPDSFFDGAVHQSENAVLSHVEKMINEGAAVIDIGGMSSRPGASEISEEEELSRIIPVIQNVKKIFPETFLSVDTFRSKVANLAVEAGADIINDISAGEWDAEIISVATLHQVPYIAMHIQGRPHNMQKNPTYNKVSEEVYDFFIQKTDQCAQLNLHDLVLDVGFGFGKTLTHNFELLKNLSLFQNLRKPLMVGISRKSMICKPLGVNPANALNGTTALHMLALQNGADILRVHDVKEAIECIKLFEIYAHSNAS